MKNFLLYLLFVPLFSFSQEQIGFDINGEASGDKSGTSLCLSADGSIVAIGAPDTQSGSFAHSGQVRIFKNVSNSWKQIGKDINGTGNTDRSGTSVSLSDDGNIVAIGAYGNKDNGLSSGHVRIFENKSGVWTQLGNSINGEAESDFFGIKVSISGNGKIVAIGATRNDGNGEDSGHVRVFENNLGIWKQIGKSINGAFEGDESGSMLSLSSDGKVLAIGSILNNGNGIESGHVRIFKYDSRTWNQIGKDINGEAAYDNFGGAISLSSDGKILAIGAINNDGNGDRSGHVRVFENKSDTWEQIGNDIDGENIRDRSGASVSLSSNGNIIAIGAIKNNDSGIFAGHVRIFKNNNGKWIKLGKDIDGEDRADGSGSSVSISSDGNILAIGAPLNDARGENSGHVRVYDVSIPALSTNSLNKEYFSYYPNPVKNELNLNLNTGLRLKQVNIYNIQSQYLYSVKTSKIDITNLPSGMYFFEVETNQGKSSKKIVIE